MTEILTHILWEQKNPIVILSGIMAILSWFMFKIMEHNNND